MEQFTGDIIAKADSKGRVFVPSVFRKSIQKLDDQRFIMRKDLYKDCLALYGLIGWEEELGRVRSKLNMHNEEHRHFYRQYMKNTELVEMDSSGRILISKKYMQQVFLTKEIRFLGMGDCIEMWNPSLFEKVSMSNEEFKDMARTLLG